MLLCCGFQQQPIEDKTCSRCESVSHRVVVVVSHEISTDPLATSHFLTKPKTCATLAVLCLIDIEHQNRCDCLTTPMQQSDCVTLNLLVGKKRTFCFIGLHLRPKSIQRSVLTRLTLPEALTVLLFLLNKRVNAHKPAQDAVALGSAALW